VSRTPIWVGALIVLTWTIAAHANTRSFDGRLHAGGTVAFKVKFRHGEPVKVRHGWEWSGLPVRCPGELTTASGRFTFPMPANDRRRFRGVGFARGETGKSRASVRGRFSRNGHRAHGTFRLRGNVNGRQRCDTGRVRWRARR
jgi:hypothetical protein